MKWRPIKTNRRCAVLNQHGKRCGRKATWAGAYHGSSEIYSCLEDDMPTWVRVEMCPLHASKAK